MRFSSSLVTSEIALLITYTREEEFKLVVGAVVAVLPAGFESDSYIVSSVFHALRSFSLAAITASERS